MKWLSIALLAVVVFAFSPAKPADAAVSFGFSAGFHDELAPYGGWVNYSNYGNCWRPYGSGYRPYVDGYWAYSSYGPTWYGNEAWAPYTYNYGYWIYTAQFGWIWVPGNDWHRNYVDWTYGGGYIGWRPQFPAGYYYPGGNDFNLWVVIDSNHFGYHDYRPYVYRSDYVRDLWNRRVFRQRYDRIDRRELERVTRRPVQYVNLQERNVRVGNRNTRMFVTRDQESRIQRHVEQVRRNSNVRDERRLDNHENVMHQKFDEIRNKSNNRNDIRERDQRDRNRQFTHPSVEHRDNNRKVEPVRREEVRSKSNEPSRRNEVVREQQRRDFTRHDSIKRVENHERKAPSQERSSFRPSHEQRFPTTADRREVSRSEQHNRSDVRVEKNRSEKKQQKHKPPHR